MAERVPRRIFLAGVGGAAITFLVPDTAVAKRRRKTGLYSDIYSNIY